MKITIRFFSLVLSCLLIACGVRETPGDRPIPYERSVLTRDELVNGLEPGEPVDYVHLSMPPGAEAPVHTFEGHLELMGEAENGNVRYLEGGEETTQETGHLPEFSFEFFQAGNHLIPVRRGLIITTHPDWDYIIEPGLAWSEYSDEGWSRASAPFFLVAKGGNSNLAGILTFLYNDVEISGVYYQITQEVAISFRADLWGFLEAAYTPYMLPNVDLLREDYEAEHTARMPTRPVSNLVEQYPGIDLQAFTRHLSPADLTTWGLVVDGMHYRGGCTTRSGEYPYCESVRMPSFSTAKTAFVAVALMRLEREYGPGVASMLIRDYLPEAADSPGNWSTVTFDNTLDMATGNFSSSRFMVDEEGRIFNEFFNVYTYEERIASALDWPQSTPPGTIWVYHSSDTFLLVAAMQNYLEEKQGAGADIFQYVVDEVYKPLELGPGFFSTARTADDNWQGLPVGATGLWWLPDDVARLGDFLDNSGGVLDGVQVLDANMLAAALQRDPMDQGLPIPGGRYNNSLWSVSFGPQEGFNCTFSIPYMAGYSGNIVALMPNGIIYYYFSDNRDFDWTPAVLAADAIHPFCQP